MRVPVPALLSWQKLQHRALTVGASASNEQPQNVLFRYYETRRAARPLDLAEVPPIFKACASLQSLKQGISLHADMIKLSFDSYTTTSNSIMSFYIKSGMTDSAVSLFSGMGIKDSVSWNVMIHGLLSEDDSESGMDLFMQARVWGFVPNISTLVLVVQACWKLEAITEGLIIHGYIFRSGFYAVISVQNSLLSMYAKSYDSISAQKLFDEMPERDVISWSALLSGYAISGGDADALRLFREMSIDDNIDVDGLAVVSVLQACSGAGDIEQGRSIHGYLIRRGFEADRFVGNCLVDMYSKCFDIESARLAFSQLSDTNMVSWNSILSGLVHNEKNLETLEVFDEMKKDGIEGDVVTLVNLLQVIKRLGQAIWCRSVHSVILRRLSRPNSQVLNSLLDAYAKCDLMGIAVKLFEHLEERNVISWSTMIAGFAQCGQPDKALAFFREMQLALEKANSVAMLSLLEACSVSADLKLSNCAHAVAVRNNLAYELPVGTAMLDLYAKCGDLNASRKIFDRMPERNIQSWNAMIGALGMNGCAQEALALFHQMEEENVKPNEITMLSLLSACNHGGLVQEGLSCFQRMLQDSSLQPGSDHYSCVIDMLGRAGHLEEAFEAVKSMPEGLESSAAAWGALLSACRSHENLELGQGAASRVLELEPSNAAGYLLSSSLYAKGGSQGNTARMRLLMREKGVRVGGGYSLVHVDQRVHKFFAWEATHPQSKEIYPMVKLLHRYMALAEEDDSPDCIVEQLR